VPRSSPPPPPAPVNPADRLGLTVFLALVAHAVVILGVTFVAEKPDRPRSESIDVVLVQQRSEEAPEDARHIAQAHQDGGGDHDEPARPTVPLPPSFLAARAEVVASAPPIPPATVPELAPPRLAQARPAPPAPEPPAPPPRPLLAQHQQPSRLKAASRPVSQTRSSRNPPTRPVPDLEARAAHAPTETVAPRREPDAPSPEEPTASQPDTPPISAAALVNRSLAMASLSAEIDQRLREYAERPRRKWVTARTREHVYASYMEAWRAKVERVGNLNYPDEARRERLSGNLLLDVALNADGSINEIVLRRSSGQRVLDDAAIRIVELAAPFARFPDAIAKETDILHIERTWVFLQGSRFASN
jgi:periplasmic protein TonB